jgi:CDP-glycerol glycerophosphotransferase (TagB/SpsB family)
MEYAKFCLKLTGYIIYQLSKLFPRNRNKWCFDDLQHLGNSRFFYIDVHENHREITAVSITRDRSYLKLRQLGFNAFHWLSPAGIYHSMTAGVYIATIDTRQINPYLSGGVLYVNLWHGNGLKACVWNSEKSAMTTYGKTLEQIARSPFCKISLFYTFFRKPDLALSTSPFLTEHLFAPQFRIPKDRFIETNFPRNAVFFWKKDRIMDFIRRYEPPVTLELVRDIIPRYAKTYIYMPTWRDSGSDPIADAGIDLERLNGQLQANNELFILKLHHLAKHGVEETSHYSHIITLDRQSDVYTLLPFTDTLITDYSSIYYDYILMDREIILFSFDLDEYRATDRELMFDYEQYTPGVRAKNFDELLLLIKNHIPCRVAERDRIMKCFWESFDNGLDIVREIKNRL